METYEFLKEIYEDAKSNYEYMRAENYRLSFEKFRNFLWVNLALFSAGLIFIKDISYPPIEFYILMFTNISLSVFILYKIAEVRGVRNIKSAKDIGYDRRIDWIYNKILPKERKEEIFYQGLILEKEELIFEEIKRVKSNIKAYSIIWFSIIIQSILLIFMFIKYKGGG